jgi:uncharacterized phage protein (TIGR01671 family)
MRQIKFKGKRTDGQGWAYGYYVKTPITAEFVADGNFLDSGKGRHCIVQNGVAHEIDPETLGMLVLSRNGVDIYEGDIVAGVVKFPQLLEWDSDDTCNFRMCGVVFWDHHSYKLRVIKSRSNVERGGVRFDYFDFIGDRGEIFEEMEVIGSIHSNPDLIEKGE